MFSRYSKLILGFFKAPFYLNAVIVGLFSGGVISTQVLTVGDVSLPKPPIQDITPDNEFNVLATIILYLSFVGLSFASVMLVVFVPKWLGKCQAQEDKRLLKELEAKDARCKLYTSTLQANTEVVRSSIETLDELNKVIQKESRKNAELVSRAVNIADRLDTRMSALERAYELLQDIERRCEKNSTTLAVIKTKNKE